MGVVLVSESVVDGEVEGGGERGEGLDGPVGAGGGFGGEEKLRGGEIVPSAEGQEKFRELAGAFEACGGEVGAAVVGLFGVANQQDGGWRLGGR